MRIEKMDWITRADVNANPEKLFLFGDNLEHLGMGGQAGAMRFEPNSLGIPTKKTPGMNDSDFFTDTEYDANCEMLDRYFETLFSLGYSTVVVPADGLGTGLAELDKRAPQTFAYLLQKLAEIETRGE